MKKLLALSILMALLMTGCSNSKSNEQPKSTNNHAGHLTGEKEESQHSNSQSENQTTYSLTAEVNDQYELLIDTNLQLSKENYDGPHIEGEGHVHLYINNQLIGPLQDKNPHPILEHLAEGENTIRLVLASNNHIESVYQTSYELTVEFSSS